jgi:heat shock protein HtpX
MIAALRRLGGLQTGGLPDSVKAFGISSESGLGRLFATHPPIEERIAALQNPA